MRATGWHNGGAPEESAGYGLKFSVADRDRSFDRAWESIVLHLDGGGVTTVALSDSFWRSCTELRSAAIGRWLLDAGVAPWSKGLPPGIAVRHTSRNEFTAKLLPRSTLSGR